MLQILCFQKLTVAPGIRHEDKLSQQAPLIIVGIAIMTGDSKYVVHRVCQILCIFYFFIFFICDGLIVKVMVDIAVETCFSELGFQREEAPTVEVYSREVFPQELNAMCLMKGVCENKPQITTQPFRLCELQATRITIKI